MSRGREDLSDFESSLLRLKYTHWHVADCKPQAPAGGGVGTLLLSWDMDGSCTIVLSLLRYLLITVLLYTSL